jgi:hypothetical protein
MRKSLLMVGIPVAVLGVAAAITIAKFGPSAKPADKFADDLQRAQAAGLDLAQAQGANKYALTEIAPESKPQPSKSLKSGSGPKAVRSKSPTVKAAPEPVAAEVAEDIPEVQVIQTAAAPTPAVINVPAVPRPVPQTAPGSGSDQGPILAGGTGGGIGMGGIFGAIIRGGGVDGDNCDPRPNARPPMRTPVYSGNPSGVGRSPIGARPGTPTGPVGSRRRGGR